MTQSSEFMLVRAFCPAKINLGLSILGRRGDGYHEIETLLQAIDWEDVLEVRLGSEKDTLKISGPFAEGVPSDKRNLVHRALKVLREMHSVPPLDIELVKNIPHGSGLGGGSSDVAGVLCAVTRLMGLEIGDKDLEGLAARVGSDTAFFIRGGAQWGRGRGEILERIPSGCERSYLVVVPAASVSTQAAYGALTPSDWGSRFDGGEVERWLSGGAELAIPNFGNAFEGPVSRACPEVGEALAWLREQGALRAFLTGSGSACVGVWSESAEAEAVAELGRSFFRASRFCRSMGRGVHLESVAI